MTEEELSALLNTATHWYVRVIEKTGEIVGLRAGGPPDHDRVPAGQIFVEVRRRPAWDPSRVESSPDRFVDLRTGELYNTARGDRREQLWKDAEQLARKQSTVGPPAPRSRVIRHKEK
jgi:hypothetical protein